jgi:hypothetical protein
MLTVKYIDLLGNETVFAVNEVRYHANDLSPCIERNGHVWFDRPNVDTKAEGVLAGVSCGSVFVMNEQGRTVATYRLGNPDAKGCASGVIGGVEPVTWTANASTSEPHIVIG